MRWAQRLKRAFQLDLEHCLQCGGPLKLIAAIEDPWIIQKILRHLQTQARGPPHTASTSGEIQLGVNLRTDDSMN